MVMLVKVLKPFNHKSVEGAPMLKIAGNYFGAMVRNFRFWVKPAPIDDFAALADFCFAQCAHIAQTTLYGYLRTRAGLQHFNLFTDETFVGMLRPARSRLMLVCVEDLALYCVAVIGERTGLSPAAMQALGVRIMAHAVDELAEADLPEGELEAYAHDFAARVKLVDWSARAQPASRQTMIFDTLEEMAPQIARTGALIGLDLGTKTIGVAGSDLRQSVASPIETIKRKKFGIWTNSNNCFNCTILHVVF